MKAFMLILVCLGLLTGLSGITRELTPKKDDIRMELTYPKGKGPFPVVIFCPGRGYHKDLPLMKDVADRVWADGMATLRFNWTYYTEHGKPSPDLRVEFKQLQDIISRVKADPQIDTTRIFLAGKSLGSLLAYAAFQEDKSLCGCLLMTPVLPKAEDGPNYYPNLPTETRSVAFILGDEDSANCPARELFTYASQNVQTIPIVILAGGHGFECYPESEDKQQIALDKEHLAMAIDTSVFWLKTFWERTKQK